MTQGDHVKIFHKDELAKKMPFINKRIEAWDFSEPLCIKLEPCKNPRSLSQNALLHIWVREIDKGMQRKGVKVTIGDSAEAWKLWLKRRFLGTDDFQIKNQRIEGQVRRSSDLSKGEMVHFMDQCYHWALDQGINLTIPKESEYAELKNQQES